MPRTPVGDTASTCYRYSQGRRHASCVLLIPQIPATSDPRIHRGQQTHHCRPTSEPWELGRFRERRFPQPWKKPDPIKCCFICGDISRGILTETGIRQRK